MPRRNGRLLGRAGPRQQRELIPALLTTARVRPQPLDLLAERVEVLKAAIHRCKPHVRDLIEAAQLVHHDLAHFTRGDLAFTEAAQLVADATDRLLDRFLTDRPLLECLAHAGSQLRLIERLARTIALDDERHGELGRLERREAFAAGETLAAAADLAALTRETRVGDLRLDVAAEGTVHAALRKWGSRDEPNRSRSVAGGAQALGALRGPLGKSARAAAGAALVNRKCAAELEHSRPHA